MRMKYIKLYEKRVISPEEKEMNNFAKRLEYNLRNFFKINTKENRSEILVRCYADQRVEGGQKVWMLIQPKLQPTSEFEIFYKKFQEIGGEHFISYDLTRSQAEELLFTVKDKFEIELLKSDAEKYNL